jgi:hypothetical protein
LSRASKAGKRIIPVCEYVPVVELQLSLKK